MKALLLVILAAICFLLATIKIVAPIDFESAGLFWLTIALLIAGWWPAMVTR